MGEDSRLTFVRYHGDTMGLTTNENYLVFRWANPDCKVLFSVCRRGDAANCHVASDKAGLRHLKQAIGEFCDYIFWIFDWCKMILAAVSKDSIARVLEKNDFVHVFDVGGSEIYARPKNG